MDEARRFLRYVTPGLVFLVETLLLLWVLLPDWPEEQLRQIKKDAGLGFVLAAILGSGGLGFVFSIAHHWLHWCSEKETSVGVGPESESCPKQRLGKLKKCLKSCLSRLREALYRCLARGSINHGDFIRRLRSNGVLSLVDATTHKEVPKNIMPTRFDAWAITTAIWHERLATSKRIKGAEPRSASLVDLMHSMGTGRIASLCALLVALAIAGRVAHLSWEPMPVFRFVMTFLVWGVVFALHQVNYERTSLAAQRVIEEILHDALAEEAKADKEEAREKVSPRTHIVLTKSEPAAPAQPAG